MPAPLTLPIISIAPYFSPSSSTPSSSPSPCLPGPTRASTAQQIHKACRDVGFFFLRLDDLPLLGPGEMDEVLSQGRAFFDRPEGEKRGIGLGTGEGDPARGYQKLQENVTQGKADHHEGLDLYHESPYAADSEEARTRQPLSGKNLWPAQPTTFRPTMERWIEKMKILGMAVMHAMADGLGMDEHEWAELREMVEDSFWVMRVIGYPPLPEGAPGVSCGAHKDYGCLTFLHADDTPHALQVFLRPTPDPSAPPADDSQGVWIDANPVPGCVVVNVGEMWEIWSNGLYRSTLHRVVHRAPTYRVSVPFFYEPAFDALVRPLDAARRKQEEEGWALAPGKKYGEVRYGDFLVGKVGGNFVKGGEQKGRY